MKFKTLQECESKMCSSTIHNKSTHLNYLFRVTFGHLLSNHQYDQTAIVFSATTRTTTHLNIFTAGNQPKRTNFSILCCVHRLT